MARQVKPLKELLDLRTRLSDLRGTLQTNDKLGEALARGGQQDREAGQAEGEIGQKGESPMADTQKQRQALPQVSRRQNRVCSIRSSNEGPFRGGPRLERRGKNLVKEFVAQVLEGSMTIARDAEMMINARIAQIDHLVSIQLNEIMHHPSFQKLEGSWRGVKYLMDQSETGAMLKIQILNAARRNS